MSLTENALVLKDGSIIQNRIGVQTTATSLAHLEINHAVFDFSKEKYAPFEGAGIDSTWKLSIPKVTGTDVSNIIMSIRYTARKGG